MIETYPFFPSYSISFSLFLYKNRTIGNGDGTVHSVRILWKTSSKAILGKL